MNNFIKCVVGVILTCMLVGSVYLVADNNKKNNELKTFEQLIVQNDIKIKELSNTFGEFNDNILQLNKDKNSLIQEKTSLQNDISQKNAFITQLEQYIEANTEQIAELQNGINAKISLIAELEQDATVNAEQIEELRIEVEVKTSHIETLNGQISQLYRELDNAQNTISYLESQVDNPIPVVYSLNSISPENWAIPPYKSGITHIEMFGYELINISKDDFTQVVFQSKINNDCDEQVGTATVVFNYVDFVTPIFDISLADIVTSQLYHVVMEIDGIYNVSQNVCDVDFFLSVSPSSIEAIDSDAYAYSDEVISIIIPETVSQIGDSAFAGCRYFEYLTVLSSVPPTLGSNVFMDCPFSVVYVPVGSLEAYQNADGWMDLNVTFVELSSEV